MPFTFPAASGGYSQLSTYTEEQQLPLLTKTIMSPQTAKYLTSVTGVRYRTAMTIADTTIVLQSASGCGWNSTGDVTFQNRVLEVAPIKVQTELCPRTLERYWLQKMLPLGAAEQNVEQPLGAVVADVIIGRIGEAIETAIWQGVTTSATNNLKYFDGFNRLTDVASASCVSANTGTITSITSANVDAVFNAIYTRIPTNILNAQDLITFCGWDTYRLAVQKYVDKNWFNWNTQTMQADGAAGNGFMLPGTTMKVVPVFGLNGTNRLMTGRASNLFFGVDLLGDEDKFDMFYSKEFDVLKVNVFFKYGVNFALPEEVVYFKL